MSKDELHARFNKFGDGQWAELLDEALRSTTVNVPRSLSVDSAERRAEAAERKVMLGEVSRAASPGQHWRLELKRRLKQCRTDGPGRNRPISQEAREFHPEAPVSIDRKVFLQCLKSASRGSSPGPGGCTFEHLKMLLDEMDTVELLLEALNCLAQAKVPSDVTEALLGARLTALAKPDGGGQGHCHRKLVSAVHRREVARTSGRRTTLQGRYPHREES